ncbi:MAG TPA: DUF3298 domain-containing protein [Reyranella sp.]|nr:DUF3298 domain-containing protein [Reyranella sp.]
MKLRAVAALALLWPGIAAAQPSFDCAKASTPVERVICGSTKLAAADRELATVYGDLAGKLSGTAKDHLLQDQIGWLRNRTKACTGETEAITRCLGYRYGQRIATLKAVGEGSYPFVSEQAIVDAGQRKAIRYEIDARYPRFDGRADFRDINQYFVRVTSVGAQDAIPGRDVDEARPQIWTYEQGFELFRPGPDAVSVLVTSYIFTGGAHGSTNLGATLVDLRSGKRVDPFEVFAPGSPWQATLTEIARADLKKQFIERPGFDDALQPDKFDPLLNQTDRYLFKAGALELIFNQYDVGPYAAGQYKVTIPYERLAKLFRPDGLVKLAPVGSGRDRR